MWFENSDNILQQVIKQMLTVTVLVYKVERTLYVTKKINRIFRLTRRVITRLAIDSFVGNLTHDNALRGLQ